MGTARSWWEGRHLQGSLVTSEKEFGLWVCVGGLGRAVHIGCEKVASWKALLLEGRWHCLIDVG